MLAALPGHAQGLGDTRHRQMVDDQPSEHPAHRRTRELGARIGRLAHILTPHVSALLAPVAAHAHMHNRGTPPVRLVRQAPDHRVTRLALAPAAAAPPVLTNDAASQGYRTKCVGFMVTFPLFGAEKSVLKLVGANLKDGQNVLVL